MNLDVNQLATLRRADGLTALEGPEAEALAAAMSGRALDLGDLLIRQGERGSMFGVVVEGLLGVSVTDRAGAVRQLPSIGPGQTINEVALLSDTPSLGTLQAILPTIVAVLPREAMAAFAERHPDAMQALVTALRSQLHSYGARFALRQNERFRDLDPGLLALLEAELEPETLMSGDVLMRAGERGTTMYIVVSGRLHMVATVPGHRDPVHIELGPGDTVGELALITGEPRSADVYAVRDTQLARLSKPAVERLLARYPSAALIMLARGPVNRVWAISSGRSQMAPVATVAVIPVSANVDLDAFVEALCGGLGQLGDTAVVSSARVDAALGRPGAAQTVANDGSAAQLLEYLAEQEFEHRFVVYRADRHMTPWSERAVRQADHIVLVADASADPTPRDYEQQLLSSRAAARIDKSLVLLHRDGHTPSRTARWLEPRTLERHFHARLASADDMARIARHLTGRAIGLALGGGFARGLAHVGVLRAFQEFGIPIDVIGGSSMGAMVAAQHLLGWDGDKIINVTAKGLEKSLDDMTIPFLSFKKGGKYSRMLETFFGDAHIEDLWLPYFCTSANLNRANVKVHHLGPLARTVLASTRAPGVFPPLVIDGELHVDGGLINNVPVDVMSKVANQGPVIGVDVSPPHTIRRVTNYGDDISGWQAIWNRFNPTVEKRSYRPSILLVLMRLIEFGGIAYRERVADQADLYISPDVLRFRRNDFHRADEIVEAGYSATRASLAEWVMSLSGRADARRFQGVPVPAAPPTPGE